MKLIISDKYNYDLTFLETVGTVQGKEIEDITVDIMGVQAVIVDMDSLKTAVEYFRPFIQSWLYFLLLLYHLNNIFKLLRGSPLFEFTGHSNLTASSNEQIGQNYIGGGN